MTLVIPVASGARGLKSDTAKTSRNRKHRRVSAKPTEWPHVENFTFGKGRDGERGGEERGRGVEWKGRGESSWLAKGIEMWRDW